MQRILFSGLAAALLCFGQAQVPATAAGKVFGAWLAAVNSGDKTKIEEFQKNYAGNRADFVERTMNVYQRSGGFDLVEVKSSQALNLKATIKERTGGRFADLDFAISDGESPRLARFQLVPAEAPAAATTQASAVETVFRAWLEAFNSGKVEKVVEFRQKYAPDIKSPPQGVVDAYEQNGGFDVVRLNPDGPNRLRGLLKERRGGDLSTISLAVTGDPVRLDGIRIEPGDTAPSPADANLTLDQLVAKLDQQAVDTKFSGTVLVAKDGKAVFRKAYGLADREKNKSMEPDSQLRMGSMNKMFTAVATLQLVEKGKLDLDAPIGKYLPNYPNKNVATKVTIRHLLTHEGGTGNIFTDEWQRARLETRELKDYEKLFGARDLLFEPGTRWDYSNYGFVLLGLLIEAVSGKSYYEYVRENIFRPAGMTSTDSLPESEIVPKRAVGYLRDGTPNTDTLPWRGSSAGGGYTTVDDLLRFAVALQNGKLLAKKLVDEATTVQAKNRGGLPYGFGFVVSGQGNNVAFGHSGGAPGMNGELSVFNSNGVIFSALSNGDNGGATALSRFFVARLPK